MLIIFDLDGTLTPQRPSSIAPFVRKLLPGVREKCVELVAVGHVLAIATNQGGLRKELAESEVLSILAWVSRELSISAVKYASGHNPARKKPNPGMLLELMSDLRFSPSETMFIGDAESDQQAAEAAGMAFRWADGFFTGGAK